MVEFKTQSCKRMARRIVEYLDMRCEIDKAILRDPTCGPSSRGEVQSRICAYNNVARFVNKLISNGPTV